MGKVAKPWILSTMQNNCPGENYPFSIKFMIFSGLTNIRELAGTLQWIVQSIKDGQREIEMRLPPAVICLKANSN